MKTLPFFHNLQQKRCLVVGGGSVAYRRIQTLISAGAVVDCISPQTTAKLEKLVIDNGGTYIANIFIQALIESTYFCVVTATDNRQVNAKVAQYFKQRNVLVNVADDPSLCDFTFPALIDRGSLSIAISNNGASPVLSRLLREKLETHIPAEFSDLSDFVGKHRTEVKRLIKDAATRKKFWQRVLQGPIADAVCSGDIDKAERLFHIGVNETEEFLARSEVYYIEIDPGAVDLLTLRAVHMLQRCDTVIHEASTRAALLGLLPTSVNLVNMDNVMFDQGANASESIAQYVRQGQRIAIVTGKGGCALLPSEATAKVLTKYKVLVEIIPSVRT